MDKMVPIQYGGFYDVPLSFEVRYQGRLFAFDCRFDEAIDEYPDFYRVYLLPDPPGPWEHWSSNAIHHFGQVSIQKIRFDQTKRRAIDSTILDELIAGMSPA
jgi:hypothetical protein